MHQLLQACAARLAELTKASPPAPMDWTVDVKLTCYEDNAETKPRDHLCTLCAQLQAFLDDGVEQLFTATLGKDESSHLRR